jgi:hypothetical protein
MYPSCIPHVYPCIPTSVQPLRNLCAPLLQPLCTLVTHLLQPLCTLSTPLLHPVYTLATTSVHPCYNLCAPFLHPCYTLSTPFTHLITYFCCPTFNTGTVTFTSLGYCRSTKCLTACRHLALLKRPLMAARACTSVALIFRCFRCCSLSHCYYEDLCR